MSEKDRSLANSGTQNGALNYSMRSSVRPVLDDKDEDSLSEFLRSRGKQGFAASAYWGAFGEVPPREPDDAVRPDAFRFKEEISRKLVPFPDEKSSIPRTLDYTHIGMHRMDVTGKGENDGLNAAQLDQLLDNPDLQLGGDGSTGKGMTVKPRFLNMISATQRMPGQFDDGVMKALRDGKQKDDDHLRHLQGLRTTPFNTANPNPYRLTSEDYCDFSNVDPQYYRVTETDPSGSDVDGDKLGVYRSRYNNVEREGPKRRQRTFDQLQKGRTVDRQGLRDKLTTDTQMTMPRGWQGYSAKDWLSTTHREHAPYDVDAAATANGRNATVPLRNTNYQLNADHELAVTKRDERHATRYTSGEDGEFATEYGDNYQDRFSQAEIKKDFAGRSVFDIQYGNVYTMDPHFHHPREDASTGEVYTPAELVPGQYTTMQQEPLHARNEVSGNTTR